MTNPSAAVIAWDEPFAMPDWVAGEFERAEIGFVAANCQTEEEVVALARGRDVLLTSSARPLLTRRVIESLTVCRAIVRIGSGVDCIDLDAATERGILVANTPGVLAGEVAERAAALLLACIHRLSSQDRQVKAGCWTARQVVPQQRLRGKTLGLIGFGRIARALVAQLQGFGLTCPAYDPYLPEDAILPDNVHMVDLDVLLSASDFISVHVPLTPKTRHLLGEREFRSMKNEAVLVNTARGSVVDQQALYRALSGGWIAGAGLDVLEEEPPAPDEPLLQLENVIVTPHTAAFSFETRDALYHAGCQAAIDLSQDKIPASVVNPEVRPWWAGEA